MFLANFRMWWLCEEGIEDGGRRVWERVVGLAQAGRGEALRDDGYAIWAAGG